MTNISSYIEQVARAYWGEPTIKRGHTYRWGNHGSKEIDLRKGTFFDFQENVGGGVIDLVKMHEPTSFQTIPEILEKKFGIARQQQTTIQPAKFMSKCYSYVDEHGEVRYEVVRFEPKDFRQRVPDGNGGYRWSMKDIEALPYNLPAILARPDEPIFVVEGEKAADKVATLGLLATTSHGGAKKWSPSLNKWFEGRNVIILPDNDEPGQQHAQIVAENLFGVANRLKVVNLSGLPDKGDVVDYLEAHDRQSLLDEVKAAPPIEAKPEPVAAEDYNNDNNEADYFEFVDEDYLMNMPPIEWAVGEGDVGLITAHGLSMIYGAPGSGKSFISLDMALSQAHGIDWQGMPVKQGDVLYIAGEGVGGLGSRVRAWKNTRGLGTSGHFHMLPIAVNMRDQAEVEKLIRSIDRLDRKWTAVYIDTLARAMLGADENSSTETGLVIAAADAIRNHVDCAVVFVHHSGKAAERGARGSSAILGAVDTSIAVTKDEQWVTMRVEKQKDAEPVDDITLEMVPIENMAGSSVVLKRLDGDEAARVKRSKPLSADQKIALEALRNVVIDTGRDRVPSREWADAHGGKLPDKDPKRRGDDRTALIKKGLVGADKWTVWLINENKELT